MSFRDEMAGVLLSLNLAPFDDRNRGHVDLMILFCFEQLYSDVEDYDLMALTSGHARFVFLSSLGHRQWSLTEGSPHEYSFLMLRDELDAMFPWNTRRREYPLYTPLSMNVGQHVPRTTRLRQLHTLRNRMQQ